MRSVISQKKRTPITRVLIFSFVILLVTLNACGDSDSESNENDTSNGLVDSDPDKLVCGTSASCISSFKAAFNKSSVAEALEEFVPANKYDFSFIPAGKIEEINVTLSDLSDDEGTVPTFTYRIDIAVDDKEFALNSELADSLTFGDLAEKKYIDQFDGLYTSETEEKLQAKNMLGQTETLPREGLRILVTEDSIVSVAVSERLTTERAEKFKRSYTDWTLEEFLPRSGDPEIFIFRNLNSADYEFITGISGEGNKMEMAATYVTPKDKPASTLAEELAGDFSSNGWETEQVQTEYQFVVADDPYLFQPKGQKDHSKAFLTLLDDPAADEYVIDYRGFADF